MGADYGGVGKRGSIIPDVRDFKCGICAGGPVFMGHRCEIFHHALGGTWSDYATRWPTD